MKVIVNGWDIPKSCAECPFFKINIANANANSSLCCRASNEEFIMADIGWLNKKRSSKCKLEIMEDTK